MAAATLTLSNRQENLKLLLDFVQQWARERNLSPALRSSLERAVKKIFQHVVCHAYPPGEPGSVGVALEEQGPRVRLIFQDDAPPHNPLNLREASPSGNRSPGGGTHLQQLQQLADSLIYYRTPDQKNRLVVFIS
jgi:anti-sigma regulatory factor (Ser/Thr protein kinase)